MSLEATLVNSLVQYIVTQLGSSDLATILVTDISKVVVLIMEWIENQWTSLLSILGEVTSAQKHNAALSYLEQLFMTYVGTPLENDIKKMVSGFISRVTEASKGQVAINGVSAPAATAVVPAPIPSVPVAAVAATGTTKATQKKLSRTRSFLNLTKQ